MLRKIFLLVTILGLFTHCGFTPLYSNKSISNFSINSTSFGGDKTINNYLKMNLNQFENNEFEKKFDLSIKTDYQKDILSKDKTAKITNFKLSCTSTIIISLNGQLIKEIKISESRNMNNIDAAAPVEDAMCAVISVSSAFVFPSFESWLDTLCKGIQQHSFCAYVFQACM